MKKLVLLITVLFISTGALVAQDNVIVDQDYCIMQDGKVVQYTKGMPLSIEKAVTLKDGSVVQPNGSYVCSKNKPYQLKEGEVLGMSGKKYASEEKLYQKLQHEKKKLMKR